MTDHAIQRRRPEQDDVRRPGLLWLWLAVLAVLLAGLVTAVLRLNGCGNSCGATANPPAGERNPMPGNSQTARSTSRHSAPSASVAITVTGREKGALSPGVSRPVVVSIVNLGSRPARITSAGVTVGDATKACRAATSIRVTGYRSSAPGATRYELAPGAAARIPLRISMLDLPTNQNACKDASFPLTFHATARQG